MCCQQVEVTDVQVSSIRVGGRDVDIVRVAKDVRKQVIVTVSAGHAQSTLRGGVLEYQSHAIHMNI